MIKMRINRKIRGKSLKYKILKKNGQKRKIKKLNDKIFVLIISKIIPIFDKP